MEPYPGLVVQQRFGSICIAACDQRAAWVVEIGYEDCPTHLPLCEEHLEKLRRAIESPAPAWSESKPGLGVRPWDCFDGGTTGLAFGSICIAACGQGATRVVEMGREGCMTRLPLCEGHLEKLRSEIESALPPSLF